MSDTVSNLVNQILFNGMPINQVRSAKFLGVYLDEHLTWSDHVKTVIVSKTCGILNKLIIIIIKISPVGD